MYVTCLQQHKKHVNPSGILHLLDVAIYKKMYKKDMWRLGRLKIKNKIRTIWGLNQQKNKSENSEAEVILPGIKSDHVPPSLFTQIKISMIYSKKQTLVLN